MRQCLLVLMLFFSLTAIAQQNGRSDSPVVIGQLSSEGILLDKGWKFKAGDNPVFAEPTFDDSQWQHIEPTKDIRELPEVQQGIGWFRIRFSLDSSKSKQPLALLIQQSGASEVYINGRLLRKYGIVSAEGGKVLAYDPSGKPLPLQHVQPGENVIAVRYALQPKVLYTRLFIRTNPALFVAINDLETAFAAFHRNEIHNTGSIVFRIGVFVLLLVLHLAFYIYYPSQKANLYFSIFAVLALTVEAFNINETKEVKYIFYNLNAEADVGQLGNVFLLTALYYLLNRQRDWIYWSLLLLVVTGFVLNACYYLIGFGISAFVINTLLNLQIVNIAFQAVRKKQRGAWLIATGAVCFFVCWISFVYCALSNKLNIPISENYTLGDLIYNLTFLCIPFATSLYLALDFAFTSRSLQQRLKEVQSLSEEKQQILAEQKERLEQQVTERTAQLKQSLEELKAMQSQLVQKEKMASLGELTAGIAHEIQNPLNFVNNFSAVNSELVSELRQEAIAGNMEEVISLADSIGENETKISHHGKRADAIVKGMLQHSRSVIGDRQPTDINQLVEEHLRLAYHGYRAKDHSFNADVSTDYAPNVEQLNIVPQEIGRVLLNLFNNAFYAVSEKKKQLNGTYEPIVSVSTRKKGDQVVITVIDNGTGMSQKVTEKVFQPFFTTKPTGEGTGLGLSLSYDIITKAHGGEIYVYSIEGEGTTLTIQLPTQ